MASAGSELHATTRDTARRRTWSTLLVWALHVACVATAGGFAAVFVLMATSLDPMEIVTAGAEPWTNALAWILAVLGVVLASAVGLLLWHSRRWRAAGIILLVVEITAMIWGGVTIYAEYF